MKFTRKSCYVISAAFKARLKNNSACHYLNIRYNMLKTRDSTHSKNALGNVGQSYKETHVNKY